MRLPILLTRFWVPLVIALTLSACFWESSPPDLTREDAAAELIVIWDAPPAQNIIRRSAWSNRDPKVLTSLIQHLDTNTWKSSSVLPAAHSTRIILPMRSGKVWEIVLSTGKSRAFRLFDRRDTGTTGGITWSEPFLTELTSLLESATGEPADLVTEHRKVLMDGNVTKVRSAEAKKQLARFPGYPEMFWNTETGKFEYTK